MVAILLLYLGSTAGALTLSAVFGLLVNIAWEICRSTTLRQLLLDWLALTACLSIAAFAFSSVYVYFGVFEPIYDSHQLALLVFVAGNLAALPFVQRTNCI